MSFSLFSGLDHAIFLSCLAIHCLFGASVFWIAFQYLRYRTGALAREAHLLQLPLPPDSELPQVLIQLPTFNEGALIERIGRCVEALDWPCDRLQVQILDDSTDASVAHSQKTAASLRRAGIAAEVVRRTNRDGFKAGALAEGLHRSQAPFAAILDADYMPEPGFLRACMRPMLNDAHLGFVQARCDYLNAGENNVTYAQQRILDAHFAVEQPARNWSGNLMPFNGTCGVWRRAAIDAAGGWQGDTLAEDLDLSYRAQLRGWRALFLSGVAVRGQLPDSMGVWRQQQFRWTKGFAEGGRKLLWPVWSSRLPLGQKIVCTLHLGGGMLGPLFVVTLITGLVDLFVGYGPTRASVSLLAFSLLGGAIIGPAMLMLIGQIMARGSTLSFELPRLPRVLEMQIANGLANLGGAVEALLGRTTAFERTPKTSEDGIQGQYASRT
ncbi:MAG TPA: glycosyltransferase [Rhizomicrobium sp.]|jgi:GT2 family glycosyltransferase|nr:glycosyltransferase [Rhizomicrobium sp.]